MKLKNLLTGILLAGSSLVYGQNYNDNSKKISELYGKQGERIAYKNYSQIPWSQLDTNEIKVKNLESVLVKPIIENQDAFRDSVFAEAEKLGHDREDIKNLETKEAVNLAVDIVASRYEYDYAEKNKHKEGGLCLHHIYKNNDFYFFRKLGVCEDYSWSSIEVFDLIKKENKNLNNIYTARREGGNHAWNQLIVLTKDSLFLSDIDITNFDDSHFKKLGLGLEYFDYNTEPKMAVLSELKDPSINYFLYKELLNQVDLYGVKISSAENYFNSNSEYYQLSSKYEKINYELKANYIGQMMNEGKDISLKKQGDSLLCEYKKIDKKIDSLTTKLNEKAKEDYETQRYGTLRGMFENALVTNDTTILEETLKYFVKYNPEKYSPEEYVLRKSLYFIYKENKNKDKAKELEKWFGGKYAIRQRFDNTKKKFEFYKEFVLKSYRY